MFCLFITVFSRRGFRSEDVVNLIISMLLGFVDLFEEGVNLIELMFENLVEMGVLLCWLVYARDVNCAFDGLFIGGGGLRRVFICSF